MTEVDPATTEVDHRPARASATMALLAAAVATGALLAGTTPAAVVGLVGVPLVGAGALRGRRRTLTAGAGLLALGALAAAALGAPALPTLVGATAAVVAWDVGENGIGLGEQVGREARTRQAEFTHAAASALVGVLTVGVGFVVFEFSAGRQPLAALVLLLAASVLLTWALRG